MNPLMNEPTALSELPPVSAWLSDMDGVLVKENRALPGANEFLAALRANNGTFVVSALLEPPLQPGHTLRFMLDGIPQAAPSPATSLQLNNVERGDHRLHVEVLSGERIIQRSEPVLFTVQRVNTSSPALRPPPPKPRPAP